MKGWFCEEWRFGAASLRPCGFWVAGVVLLFLYSLALDTAPVVDLDVGAGLEPGRANSFDHLVGTTFRERVGQPYDTAFLEGFYAEEQGADYTFRWSERESHVRLNGLNRGPLLLQLRMHGAPYGVQTVVKVQVGRQEAAEFPVGYPLHVYSLVVDPQSLSGGTLDILLQSTPFEPGGDDTRVLGIALDWVRLVGWSWGSRFSLHPLAVELVLAVTLLYLGLCRAGVGKAAAGGCAALLGIVLLAALLLPARPFVAAYAGKLLLALALSYPVLITTLRVVELLFRRAQVPLDCRVWRWLALIFFISFVLRFAGALSPRYMGHDVLFHANRLEFIERGALFFEHSSAEAGFLGDPYPPGFYLLVSPFTLISQERLGLLAFFVAWLGSSEVFLVWFLARRLMDARASRWAAFLYMAFPLAVAPYWFGIYTNLFASWVVLVLLVFSVLALEGRLPVSPLLWVIGFALFFLSHLGAVVLWVPVMLLWGAALCVYCQGKRRLVLQRLLLSWLWGLLLAVVLYYSHYPGFFAAIGKAVGLSIQERVSAGGAEVLPDRLGRAVAELRVWWRWGVVAGYAGFGLGLGLLALPGYGRRAGRELRTLVILIVLVALVFWAVSMLTFFFTRYMLFLLPVAALGCGAVLSQWWRRGVAGRLVGAVLLLYVCAMTIAMWVALCFFGLHPVHVL